MTKTNGGKPFTGRQFLYVILGFFGLVIGMNILMAYFAVDTFSGVVTEDAYKKGRDYNDELARADAQAALGWRVGFIAEPVGTREVALIVTARNRNGDPLDGLLVRAEIRRPARSDLDRMVDFAPLGGGQYRANVALPLDGRWLISLRAGRDGDTFRLDDEFMVGTP